jgi:arsenate reductase (thioredoxin)
MKTVVFLCPHNALRSVIAAALFNRDAAGLARAESAGTEPDPRVNERTITVLREVGLEVPEVRPERVTREQLERADRVVSLGCPLEPEPRRPRASSRSGQCPIPRASRSRPCVRCGS